MNRLVLIALWSSAALWLSPLFGLSTMRAQSVRETGAAELSVRHLFDIGPAGPSTADRVEFGNVQAVAPGVNGEFVVLDARLNRLYAFSRDGKRRATVGRAGAGPGEIGVARAIGFDDRKRLTLLDVSNLRITRFEVTDTSLRYESAASISVNPHTMCQLDDQSVLFGYADDRIVHVLDRQGRTRRSFGTPFGGEHRVLRSSLSQGEIACIPATGSVLVLPLSVPVLRHYAASGELLASWDIADYKPIDVRAEGVNRVTYTIPPDGMHEAVGLAVLDETHALVQLGYMTLASRKNGGYEFIESRVYDLRTGRSVFSTRVLPRVRAAGNGRLFAMVDEDEPTVRVYAFTFREATRDRR